MNKNCLPPPNSKAPFPLPRQGPCSSSTIAEDSESNIDKRILDKLSGMIRSNLAKNIKIRRVPKINFRFDESIEYSENIERLLRNLK